MREGRQREKKTHFDNCQGLISIRHLQTWSTNVNQPWKLSRSAGSASRLATDPRPNSNKGVGYGLFLEKTLPAGSDTRVRKSRWADGVGGGPGLCCAAAITASIHPEAIFGRIGISVIVSDTFKS